MKYNTLITLLFCSFSTQCFSTPTSEICGGGDNINTYTISGSRLKFDYGWITINNVTKPSCIINIKVNSMSPQPPTLPTTANIFITGLMNSSDSSFVTTLCSYMDDLTKKMNYDDEFKVQTCNVGSEYRLLRYFDHPEQPPENNNDR